MIFSQRNKKNPTGFGWWDKTKEKKMRELKIIKGDIFESNADAILHQVNCQGVMGSGVAKQVREKYPNVYQSYKRACDKLGSNGVFGKIQVCAINPEKTRFVVNLFSQLNYGYSGCYTDYEKLKECLKKVNERFSGRSVAIPYLMGCHRGGGNWEVVSKIIEETLIDCNVTLYQYNGK